MFKVKAPREDYTREIAGVHFIDGKAETENETIARWLEGRGFEVEGEPVEPKQKNIAKMNVDELDNYAAELGVDISSCANKEEKKIVIKSFLEAQ